MNMFSIVLASLAAAEWQFPYDDQTGPGWDGYCQDTDFQQTPLDLTGVALEDSPLYLIELEHATDFLYYPRMLMDIQGKGSSTTLETIPSIAPHSDAGTSDPSDLSTIAKLYLSTDDATTTYKLNSLHMHYGMAEHVLGFMTDGNFHVLFTDEDNNYAVFEIPFKFSDTGADTPWSVHTKCANEYPEDTTQTAVDVTTADDIDSTGCGVEDGGHLYFGGKYSSMNHEGETSPGQNLFDLLVGQEVYFNDMIHYTGSTTVPSCLKNIKWFVHRGAPYEIKPIAGFEDVQEIFPNSGECAGNYREPQPILTETKFYPVESDESEDQYESSSSRAQYGLTSAVVVAILSLL